MEYINTGVDFVNKCKVQLREIGIDPSSINSDLILILNYLNPYIKCVLDIKIIEGEVCIDWIRDNNNTGDITYHFQTGRFSMEECSWHYGCMYLVVKGSAKEVIEELDIF